MLASIRASYMVHLIGEQQEGRFCMNPNCMKERNGEKLKEEWEGYEHYISWNCSDCGTNSWWRTKEYSAGLHSIVMRTSGTSSLTDINS